MTTNPFQKPISDAAERLIQELQGRFVEIPRQICKCGKPVVFAEPHESHVFNCTNCTRCSRQYLLIVKIVEVNLA